MLTGINLSLFIGQNNPQPAPFWLVESINNIEIIQNVTGRSVFQITFAASRSISDQGDEQLLSSQLLNPFNRVIISVVINAMPKVLMDGIITRQEFAPSNDPGESTLIITGEDVSVMMDLEEKSIEHPGLAEQDIINQIISSYSKYGLVGQIINPPISDRPTPNERTPVQQGTDLEYIQYLAERHSYLFYIIPGPVTGKNTAYWGPPQLNAAPQKALTVNMGSSTNVDSINLQMNALAPAIVGGSVQDRKTNQIHPIQVNDSTRENLSRKPALQNQSSIRKTQFRETARLQLQADSRSQAMLNRSIDRVITVNGELDTLTYGDVLNMGKIVELRGVGYTYDGRYYINSVTHRLGGGEYRQLFILTREGLGTTIMQVAIV
ncbi:hypothetical protein H6G41_15390 [Tolypothrix sp. FACHB-123]|uniref:hypothetical protein n=1 Tax=Tolypothrix sp. FACHB-123 TaxID=2692868 RepID=UPI0016826907|nr:hypothetical protein [Tolypothrix sp. FACHB-123]MBD2355989.1 hypothetical protein [Tolypothrix sp. FACHB-123]